VRSIIVSKAVVPIAILVIAGFIYGLGGSLGPHIGPGSGDILEGIAIFIGIIGMALGAGRVSRAQSNSKDWLLPGRTRGPAQRLKSEFA
jgi:hypothetical protein